MVSKTVMRRFFLFLIEKIANLYYKIGHFNLISFGFEILLF